MLRVSQLHGFNHLKRGGDPYWGNVVLYAPFTNATQFTDLKGHEFTSQNCGIVATGGIFGEGYLSLPGTSSRVYGASSTFSDLKMNSDNFTWEVFISHDSSGGDTTGEIYSTSETASPEMNILLDRDTGIFTVSFYGGLILTSTTALTTSPAFVYVQRSGNTFSLYIDNVLQDTDTYSGSITSADAIVPTMGNISTGALDAKITMNYLRITKGVARNSPAIPTAPFPNS